MASLQKQAKRAKRAKDKAKQTRTSRSMAIRHDAESENLIEQIRTQTLQLFAHMDAAEEEDGRVAMLRIVIEDPLTMLDEDPVGKQRVMLQTYYNVKGEPLGENWWSDAGLLQDYAQAARESGQPGLIDIWNDQLDGL